jgi:hypothetical protein
MSPQTPATRLARCPLGAKSVEIPICVDARNLCKHNHLTASPWKDRQNVLLSLCFLCVFRYDFHNARVYLGRTLLLDLSPLRKTSA